MHDLAQTTDGKVRMVYTGQTPWHRLGERFERLMTPLEALQAAHLDYEVRSEPAYRQVAPGHFAPAANARITVRYDGVEGEDGVALGVVTQRYVPLQNRAMANALEPLGQVIETAGALGQGERVWMLGRLSGDVAVRTLDGREDVLQRYLLALNSHDGTVALRVMATLVRVVCANTMGFALRNSTKADGIVLRHTATAAQAVAQAADVVARAIKAQDEVVEQAQVLANKPLSRDEFVGFAYQILRSDHSGEHVARPEHLTTVQRRNTQEDIDALLQYFESGAGNVGETAWDAFNAVTEWIDHHKARYARSRQAASRAAISAVLGEGERKKRKALRLLLKS